MSSLRRGHANLLCIVPILVYVLREQYNSGRFSTYIYLNVHDTGTFGLFFLHKIQVHIHSRQIAPRTIFLVLTICLLKVFIVGLFLEVSHKPYADNRQFLFLLFLKFLLSMIKIERRFAFETFYLKFDLLYMANEKKMLVCLHLGLRLC